MCEKFQIKKKQWRNFRNWLLYDTTIDPFMTFIDREKLQELEVELEKMKEELRKKKSGSNK